MVRGAKNLKLFLSRVGAGAEPRQHYLRLPLIELAKTSHK